MTIRTEVTGPIFVVTIDRAERKNAVDREAADGLIEAFERFESDESLSVAVLTGAGGTFCAGADLKAVSQGKGNRIVPPDAGHGPMGPTRMNLAKPVICAIEGHAVAGGLELAIWCDLRVAGRSAVLGVYCRRFGVPLVDGGTVRLPRLIGESRAMDLILTGRGVTAPEAESMGLVNKVVDDGLALTSAIDLARSIAAFPQVCLRGDRTSAKAQWSLTEREALMVEYDCGVATVRSGETISGAARFMSGEGRHGGGVEPHA